MISSSQTTDQKLLDQVRRFLKYSGYSELQGLQCQVQDGVVTLTGEVSLFYLKQQAQSHVGRIQGIQGVRNQISVKE